MEIICKRVTSVIKHGLKGET